MRSTGAWLKKIEDREVGIIDLSFMIQFANSW
jgi:hypothetical protein